MLQTRIPRNTPRVTSNTTAAPARSGTPGPGVPGAPDTGPRADLPGEIRERMESSFGADFSRGRTSPGAGPEQGFLNDARPDRGGSAYRGPVSPIGASSAASAAGPIQAKKKDKTPRTKDGTDVSEFAEGPLTIERKTDSDAVKSVSTWRQLQEESNLEDRKGDYARAAAGLRKKAAAGVFDRYDNAGTIHGDYEGTNLKWGALGLRSEGPSMKEVNGRSVVDTDAEAARMGRLLGSLAEGREIMRRNASTPAPAPEPSVPAPEPPAPEPPVLEQEPPALESEPPAPAQEPPVQLPAQEPVNEPTSDETGTAGTGGESGEKKHSGRRRRSHSGQNGGTHEHSGKRKHRRTALTSEELKRREQENDEDFRSRKLAGGVFEDKMNVSLVNDKAMSDEKRRMGLRDDESISGNEAFERYLASSLAFREGGGMGDVFAQGKQDPKAMARFLVEDMQRLIHMNHKALFSPEEDTAMGAHSEMLKFQRLGAGINGVIQYAQENKQKDLLKRLKKGNMAKFLRKQGRFEEAMSGAEALRNKKDRYYKSKDDDERIDLMRELAKLKEKRRAAMKASEKFTNG